MSPQLSNDLHMQAVLTGLAPNGGLYIPDSIPTLPPNWVNEWKNLSFIELAHAVLSLYIPTDEIPSDDLKRLVEKSYGTFRHPDTTPLHQLDDVGEQYVLELFHGPTFAFKDVALQLLGNLFEYFLARRNKGKPIAEQERLTVVGATSGDTGRYAQSSSLDYCTPTDERAQCCHLWSPWQAFHQHLHPPPPRPRIPYPRGPNDDRH